MGNTAEEKAIVSKKFLSRKHSIDFADFYEKKQIKAISGKKLIHWKTILKSKI